MEWQPIETAPKDGQRVLFKNEHNGLTDAGHWKDWRDMPSWRRELLPDHAKEWDGEWSTDCGNGDMTHWMPLSDPPQIRQ